MADRKIEDYQDILDLPADVWKRSQEKAVNLWKDGKPKKWYFAIPIVIFWMLVIWLIAREICL